ncbi:MAG: DUF5009 domain-containing protein [Symploca sp. SIO3E6]|nr:DUF5009 domain-containing protein [Caldora sp. SIO3E6]
MILVNNPGSWAHVYPPLLHAKWHGFTPTDLVFPSFLFIIGVAMAFSLAKYTKGNQPTAAVYWRIARRSALLFALGVFLNASTLILDWLLNGKSIDWSTFRIMGVLQRISLAYLLATVIVLNFSSRKEGNRQTSERKKEWGNESVDAETRGRGDAENGNPTQNLVHPRQTSPVSLLGNSQVKQWILAGAILLGYWGAMALIPVPGFAAGDFSPEGNLGGYIDSLILGSQHLYKGGPFDPEGLFSTIPAVVTVLLGYFAGQWLRSQPVKSNTSIQLVLAGLSCLVVGYLWGFLFPINKALWTSSYVVYSAGWDLLLLAACYETIEVRNWRRWGLPFEVMGLNAIFLFVGSGIVARILHKTHIGAGDDAPSTYAWIYENIFQSWAGALNGSLFFALTTVLLWWLILYGMYRRSWFFKV